MTSLWRELRVSLATALFGLAMKAHTETTFRLSMGVVWMLPGVTVDEEKVFDSLDRLRK